MTITFTEQTQFIPLKKQTEVDKGLNNATKTTANQTGQFHHGEASLGCINDRRT